MNRSTRDGRRGGYSLRGTGRNRACDSSIPRSPSQGAVLTLSTQTHRWLREDVWGEAEITYFSQHWPSPWTGMSQYPSFVRHNHHRQKLVFLGRWMLSKVDGTNVAAVELQGVISSFTQVLIRVGPGGEQGGWCDPGQAEALAHLISAVIVMHKADFVRVIPVTEVVSRQLEELGWGSKASLWSPNLKYLAGRAGESPAAHVTIRTIDPEDWWKSVPGEKGHRALSYLEKRMSLAELQEKGCRPQRSGLFQRLGRLLRWS